MKQQAVRIALGAFIACGTSFAAEKTWTGMITSTMCSTASGMGHDCILNCIKAGAKYVFVTKGQVHTIHNQDFSDLEQHAGDTVRLTGDLGGDGKSITVTRIATAPGVRK